MHSDVSGLWGAPGVRLGVCGDVLHPLVHLAAQVLLRLWLPRKALLRLYEGAIKALLRCC